MSKFYLTTLFIRSLTLVNRTDMAIKILSDKVIRAVILFETKTNFICSEFRFEFHERNDTNDLFT